jgi:hypothetical protein
MENKRKQFKGFWHPVSQKPHGEMGTVICTLQNGAVMPLYFYKNDEGNVYFFNERDTYHFKENPVVYWAYLPKSPLLKY